MEFFKKRGVALVVLALAIAGAVFIGQSRKDGFIAKKPTELLDVQYQDWICDEAGLLNLSQSRRMDFIVWMDYTASAPEKSFGLLDEETGCYIALPIEREGNLMLTDSTDEEDAVELRTVDENKLVLTLRLASSSENAVGWTRLGVVASRQMQAKLGPDVTIEDPDYRLSRSLYRLN